MSIRHPLGLVLALTTLVFVPSRPRLPNAAEPLAPNDNRRPAGTLAGNVLTIQLEARQGTFYPEGEGGAGLPTFGWAEAGKPLQTPGPLIRVKAGTVVKASVRNALPKPLTVYGLARERGKKDSLVIAPGATGSAEFTATTPGTYYYAGQTVPGPLEARVDEDGQLNGVIVVDPPAAAVNDRIFVISWFARLDSTSASGIGPTTMAINGLSWPHTERLDVVQNDSVRWRVVNLTSLPHPMHLHGFYFRIDGKGDGIRDTLLAPADRRMTVTETVFPGQTLAMTWSPVRAGNWIFHCHFAGHLSHLVSLDTDKGVAHPENEHAHMSNDAPHQMYGLVMGIRVAPRGPMARAPENARKIRLLVREKEGVYGNHQGYSYVLGGTPAESNAEMMPVPGPTLVLERNQPVAVNIVNQSKEHAAVHWHGIELQSYPDGVPGWSGSEKDILPAIAPGDSITVRFTPPRAGTFMYHSHFNEFKQIPSGLYGPIIVLAPGQKYDPETDRFLLFSDGGPTTNVVAGPFPRVFLNGREDPDPMDLRVGVRYRFRVIGITGDLPASLRFINGDKPVEWRAIARDGMDLPASQATVRPAEMIFEPGQIFDFEYTPRTAGDLTIEFGQPPFVFTPPAVPPKPGKMQVHVR